MTSFFKRFGATAADNKFPVIPIVPGGKYPGQYTGTKWIGLTGWQRHGKAPATDFQISIWEDWPEAGVGIVCGTIVGIDIDILSDPEIALKVEEIAREIFGDTPLLRIGNAPKRLLVYRTEKPFAGLKQHPIEILADGQQFVAWHIHPDTQRPYLWQEESPADVDASDLPAITEAQVRQFLARADEIIPEHLKPKTLTQKTRQTREHFTGNSDLRGTWEAIADALTYIPNPDLAYDEWISVGMGIKGALGEGGYELFLAWSSQAGKNEPDYTEKTWGTLHPTSKGAGSIYYLAEQQGWVPKAEHTLNAAQAEANASVDISAVIAKAEAFSEPEGDEVEEFVTSDLAAKMVHHEGVGEPVGLLNEPETGIPVTDKPSRSFPTHCLETDGLLGSMCSWIDNSAIKRQPVLTMLNCITALAAVYGRRYKSEWSTRTNLLTVGLAGTAAGKDHSRQQIKRLFADAGCGNLLMGDRVASGQGMLTALGAWPSRIAHYDEFGLMLDAIGDNRASGPMKDIMKTMLELYSSSGSTYLGNEYASTEVARVDIVEPSLSIYGTSTPETFWPALSSAAVVNGALNRFIVLPSQNDYPDAQRPINEDPPARLLTDLKNSFEVAPEDAGNMANTGPNAVPQHITVGWTSEVEEAVFQLDKDQSRLLRTRGEGHQLYGRLTENTIKLAMISAISVNPHTPKINMARLTWAREITEWSISWLRDAVKDQVADNQIEADLKRVARIIREARKKGLTRREITRKTQWLGKQGRERILADLMESGTVERVTEDTPGRPREVFRVTASM